MTLTSRTNVSYSIYSEESGFVSCAPLCPQLQTHLGENIWVFSLGPGWLGLKTNRERKREKGERKEFDCIREVLIQLYEKFCGFLDWIALQDFISYSVHAASIQQM